MHVQATLRPSLDDLGFLRCFCVVVGVLLCTKNFLRIAFRGQFYSEASNFRASFTNIFLTPSVKVSTSWWVLSACHKSFTGDAQALMSVRSNHWWSPLRKTRNSHEWSQDDVVALFAPTLAMRMRPCQ